MAHEKLDQKASSAVNWYAEVHALQAKRLSKNVYIPSRLLPPLFLFGPPTWAAQAGVQ